MNKTKIFYIANDNFNLEKYKNKIITNNKSVYWTIKKINNNLFECTTYDLITFKFYFEELSFFEDEDLLIDSVKKLVNKSLWLSKNININEPMEINEDDTYKLTKLILLKINNFFSYKIHNIQNPDIFDLIAFIEYSLLQNHTLVNGNKRFAFSFLIMFLQSCGFYLKWSSINYIKEKTYESKMVEWIELMNEKKLLETDIIENIKKTIEANSIININF